MPNYFTEIKGVFFATDLQYIEKNSYISRNRSASLCNFLKNNVLFMDSLHFY